ncbi:beta-ketoacyl-ACP synthase, partial [Xanthomonas oryzae pv. oryzae]
MSRRVVVTGMGIVSPLGNDLATSWDGIVHGRSGIGPITQIDASQFTTKIAGEIKNFDPTLFVSAKDVKKMDSFIHYGLGASFMALDDSGLEIDDSNAERVGAILGSGIGGLLGIEEQTIKFHEGGARKISPFYVPSTIINMLPGQVSLIKGLKGPTFSAVSACATSNHSIGTAMRMIQHGDADVMLAGGA